MDQNGAGILIEQEKLHLSMNIQPEQFSLDKFRYMCILSGCDYLPSISGIGLIKARQFITRTSEPDIYKVPIPIIFACICFNIIINKICCYFNILGTF
jgi:5'-3' exonuclease